MSLSYSVGSPPPWQKGVDIRTGDAATLAAALRETRTRTLALAEAWRAALGEDMRIPYAQELNPPLWELGHIAWFQDWWISRNRQRERGVACDPDLPRRTSRLVHADDWYNSSLVPHATRWQLPLPTWQATLDYLEAVLADSLGLLARAGAGDDALYFWRLALLHEDMHNEAATYMAQALDIALPSSAAARGGYAQRRPPNATALRLPSTVWHLGSEGPGFAFDNECPAYAVELDAFEIDASAVSWTRYLEFAQTTGREPPLHVRERRGRWEERRFGHWVELDLEAPAVHLSHADAQAWCEWAGRRLPSEAEWEYAAMSDPRMHWGEVWEWTASAFQPFEGFVPHPYRDYSQPWFGDRMVLRGACAATSAHLMHPRYRNFFPPTRRDIFAGFRSCAR
jgi:EgtB-related family protein